MTDAVSRDQAWMDRAARLAWRGHGGAEPNPMVGCVVVQGGQVVGEGWHTQFGQPHAEVEALRGAGSAARGATMLVTLEPCCHHGKTPPCVEAIIDCGIARVVFAVDDPHMTITGGGAERLAAAGIQVARGLLGPEARALNAPYFKLITRRRPWVIAKWAMSLDGKIASHSGDSRWISGPPAREVVHRLRRRVDAIVVGHGTAVADDPLLTARPPGQRTVTRIVMDSHAALSLSSQLVQTANEAPVLVAVGPDATEASCAALQDAGCEVFRCGSDDPSGRLTAVLDELGRREMTNVLVEGGSTLLGTCFDAGELDEFHVFIAPKLIGGRKAPSPLGGRGHQLISQAVELPDAKMTQVGNDVYITGRVTIA